jgi:hypothetical protein
MLNQEYLTTSKNGIAVYYDSINSHTATHFSDTPQLKSLVKEVIEKIELNDESMQFDTHLGRIIGNTDLVSNSENDEIVYAKRKNRNIYTSFNKTKKPQPCSVVAMGLARQPNGEYDLLSAWIGSVDSPPFPGDEKETPESKPYWMTHSLVWRTQEVQAGSETSVCPW